MLAHALLVLHIAVLGYWLGAELVINANFRFVTRASDMAFHQRDRLLDHVLDVDQHVRYALILQAGLGVMLAGLLGYLPGGNALALTAALLASAWLVLVEFTHRLRKRPIGSALARIDAVVRYSLMAALIATGAAAFAGLLSLPGWLVTKLALFAAVILCGLGIRWEIIQFYKSWFVLEREGTTVKLETELRRRYRRATTILVVLWALIVGIVVLSINKPL